MPVVKLDHQLALTARCPAGKRKVDLYSSEISGFVLEIRASGGKTYYLRYDQNGRQKQHKIGRWEDVSFAAAKRAAQRLRSEVVLGEDPAARKAQAKAVPTYAEFAVHHLADAKLHQRSFKTTEMYVRRYLVPRFGKLRINEIDSRMVAAWLASKREGGLAPATCEKLRSILGRSYVLAEKWGIPGSEKNPARGLPRKPLNNARERFLTAEEAARLRSAVATSRNRQLGSIISLLLFTGARVGELLRAEWRHVDLDAQRWFIERTKTGKSRYVPLSQAAVDVIAAIPRPKGATYLFPSPADANKPLGSIKHGWQTARDAAGLGDLRIHDLRHSAASFMINSGVDLAAVGAVLGHASYQSTQRYSHLANDTLLAAVEAGAAKQALPTA